MVRDLIPLLGQYDVLYASLLGSLGGLDRLAVHCLSTHGVRNRDLWKETLKGLGAHALFDQRAPEKFSFSEFGPSWSGKRGRLIFSGVWGLGIGGVLGIASQLGHAMIYLETGYASGGVGEGLANIFISSAGGAAGALVGAAFTGGVSLLSCYGISVVVGGVVVYNLSELSKMILSHVSG